MIACGRLSSKGVVNMKAKKKTPDFLLKVPVVLFPSALLDEDGESWKFKNI